VTCKCDLPVASRQLDLQAIEESCQDKAGIDCFQASLKAPETHKRCISVMLKNLAPEKLGQYKLYLIQSFVYLSLFVSQCVGAISASVEGKCTLKGGEDNEGVKASSLAAVFSR